MLRGRLDDWASCMGGTSLLSDIVLGGRVIGLKYFRGVFIQGLLDRSLLCKLSLFIKLLKILRALIVNG